MFSRTITLALMIAAMAVLPAGNSHADCGADFDIAKAKGFKASLVRMFEPCPRVDIGGGSNNETEGGTDACSPVTPAEVNDEATAYEFAPGGSCSLRWKSKIENDCSRLESQTGVPLGLPAEACHVAVVQVKCKEIVNGLQQPVGEDDMGWTLHVTVRATIEDPLFGPMTLVDLPLEFGFFPAPEDGKMSMTSTTAEAMVGIGEVLPPCTNLEIVSLSLRDPLGLPFATMGMATIP